MKLAPSPHCSARAAAAVGLLCAAVALAPAALAQHGHERGGAHHGAGHPHPGYHGYGNHHWHGNAGVFYGPGWRGGHWAHGHHGGRLGWWWVVGPSWYFYPAPVYPYPAEVLVPGTLPMPVQYWYYCEPLRSYYPHVSACPTLWKAIPATPGAFGPAPFPIPQVP